MRIIAGTFLSVLTFNAFAIDLPSSPVERLLIESQYGEGQGQSVLEQLYPKAKKVELNLGGLWAPFSSITQMAAYTAGLVWHLPSSRHALEPIWFSGFSTDSTDFVKNSIAAISATAPAEIQIEMPVRTILASYQYSPWYNKMHLSPKTVAHFDTYLGAGVGLMRSQIFDVEGNTVGEIESKPAFGVSAGMRFFMGSRWAARFEVRDVFSKALQFGAEETVHNFSLGAGLSVFFGSFPERTL